MALLSDALPITSAAVSNWPIAQPAQPARMPARDVGAVAPSAVIWQVADTP